MRELEWLGIEELREGRVQCGDVIVDNEGTCYVITAIALPFVRAGFLSDCADPNRCGEEDWRNQRFYVTKTFDMRTDHFARAPFGYLSTGEMENCPSNARFEVPFPEMRELCHATE